MKNLPPALVLHLIKVLRMHEGLIVAALRFFYTRKGEQLKRTRKSNDILTAYHVNMLYNESGPD